MSGYAFCEIMVIGDKNCFNHFTDDIYEEFDRGVYKTPKGITFLRVAGFFKYRPEDLKERSKKYKCKVEAYSYCFEEGGILHEFYENGKKLEYQRLEESDLDGFQGDDDDDDFYVPEFGDYFEILELDNETSSKSNKTTSPKSKKTTEKSTSAKTENEKKKTTKSSGSGTQKTKKETKNDDLKKQFCFEIRDLFSDLDDTTIINDAKKAFSDLSEALVGKYDSFDIFMFGIIAAKLGIDSQRGKIEKKQEELMDIVFNLDNTLYRNEVVEIIARGIQNEDYAVPKLACQIGEQVSTPFFILLMCFSYITGSPDEMVIGRIMSIYTEDLFASIIKNPVLVENLEMLAKRKQEEEQLKMENKRRKEEERKKKIEEEQRVKRENAERKAEQVIRDLSERKKDRLEAWERHLDIINSRVYNFTSWAAASAQIKEIKEKRDWYAERTERLIYEADKKGTEILEEAESMNVVRLFRNFIKEIYEMEEFDLDINNTNSEGDHKEYKYNFSYYSKSIYEKWEEKYASMLRS